ncbi:hypothetical protein D3C72_2034700 [compost metagenome]
MAFALLETTIAKQHRHVDIRAQHIVAAFTGDQAHVHLRIGGVKPVQSRHQPISGERKVGRDLQHFMLLL